MDNQGASASDLTRLIEAEQRLEEVLTSARTDAGALVESARTDAAAAEVALERELQESDARLESEVESESARRVAEVETEGRRVAAGLDAVPEARIVELAAVIVTSLVGGNGGGP